jgi:hypothetical protein
LAKIAKNTDHNADPCEWWAEYVQQRSEKIDMYQMHTLHILYI